MTLFKYWFFRTNPDGTVGTIGIDTAVTETVTTATSSGTSATVSDSIATPQNTSVLPVRAQPGRYNVP